MCGIVGYIGDREVVPVLLEGLGRLEYRGYDSAGIALVRDGQVAIRRCAGKVAQLAESIRAKPVSGDYGVGHTRWATHGRPTEENAHPHQDCTGEIVVVHNGIIENHGELKRRLLAEGHRFVTDTDTEVVAHLVEQEQQSDGLDNAVRRALQSLRGAFALVLAAGNDPGKIVAVRNGPPLVVGVGRGESFLASDTAGVAGHTQEVLHLGDQEMAVVTKRWVEFTDFSGQALQKVPQRISRDPGTVRKGGYRHFMLKEIFEQPQVIRETLAGRMAERDGTALAGELDIPDSRLRAVEQVAVLACGTSWHAALVGKFWIERLARLRVEVDYGSEYRYRDPLAGDRTLAVAITQSGETADTLAALSEAQARGATSIAICNVIGSTAARLADATVYTRAGIEVGVASTKAFTSQLAVLAQFALRLARVRGAIGAEDAKRHVAALARLPDLVQRTLGCDDRVAGIAKRFYRRSNFLYLGRGTNYPIALEGALKLKEISYLHAEGYPAGEMKHGPIALIDERVPIVAVAPREPTFGKMLGNLQEAKARGADLVVVSDAEPEALAEVLDPESDSLVLVPPAAPLLTPILATVPLQLLAYRIAVLRGCDVDQPRNLAKSVTVE